MQSLCARRLNEPFNLARVSETPLSNALYNQDFYAWANEQAGLLRAGKLAEADIEHIAEEIESLGKTEKRNWSAA
jgi:hypothetical protein